MTYRPWPSITYGLRYWNGYFYLYLMWIDSRPPHRWCWSRGMINKRYRSLERAIAALDRHNTGQGEHVIMIFPP